jgi:hypothetical protein
MMQLRTQSEKSSCGFTASKRDKKERSARISRLRRGLMVTCANVGTNNRTRCFSSCTSETIDRASQEPLGPYESNAKF